MNGDRLSHRSAQGGWLNGLGSSLRAWLGETVPASPLRDSPRVLVVDDDPVNLLLMSRQLEARGLAALLAEDGAEAVALAGAMPFDLILMDLHMPVLGGLAAAVAIRQAEAGTSRRAVPIVAFSSALPGGDTLSAHGLDDSLAKPCDEQALEACLVRWCPTYRRREAGRVGRP